MPDNKTWLLPDGVFDYLPEQAFKLESLRRRLLDVMISSGYQLVFTPLIEYVESMLVQDNPDLDLITFKVIDQLTGRLMGVRADITPQIARIDALTGQPRNVGRYCYIEEVARTTPEGLSGLRTQFQLGAEVFGSTLLEVDLEVLTLLVELVSAANLTVPLQLDIGHIGIFKRLTELAQLDATQSDYITELFQRKAIPELKAFCEQLMQQGISAVNDLTLLALYGHDLPKLKTLLSASTLADSTINEILDQLVYLQSQLTENSNIQISIDAAELQGYHYHTGLVFALYAPTMAEPLAQGGRYDHIGAKFGHSRPATGFSCYLSKWLPFIDDTAKQKIISVPSVHDSALKAALHVAKEQARTSGHIVLAELSDQSQPDHRATHRFTLQDQQWAATPL